MTRAVLLNEINELIESEYGESIEEHQKLIESGIDSFGLTMVLVELDQKYNIYPKEVFRNLVFEKITAKSVIDDILAKA